MVSKQDVKRELLFRGIKGASTFTGFCEDHDKIFQNVIEDVTFKKTEKQCFYHVYRAYAYYMHKEYELYCGLKKTMVEGKEIIKEKTEGQEAPDLSNVPDSMKNMINSFKGVINGIPEVFDDLVKKADIRLFGASLKKDRLDHAVENDEYSDFKYCVAKLDGIYPFACSSVVPYIHVVAQQSSDGVAHSPEYVISIFPESESNSTWIIFGAYKENPNVEIVFSRLKSPNRLKFVSDLLLSNGSNIYLSPRMYNKMNDSERKELIDSRVNKGKDDIGLPEINLNLFSKQFKD